MVQHPKEENLVVEVDVPYCVAPATVETAMIRRRGSVLCRALQGRDELVYGTVQVDILKYKVIKKTSWRLILFRIQ